MPDTALDISSLIEQYRPKPRELDANRQRGIAKGNALAEAFRVLLDVTGGLQGGNIIERQAPTNAVLQAVDRYQKIKDEDRAEQGSWDKLGLSQKVNQINTEQQQKFQAGKQQEAQEFQRGERLANQEFQAGEKAKDRQADADKVKQQAEQFRANLGMQRENIQSDERTKMAEINARVARTRPYGAENGIYIDDPDIKGRIHIPDDSKSQILAYIESDPNVKNEIPIIKLRYGNVPANAAAEFIMADLYGTLTPETRAKIRTFVGQQGQTQPQGAKPAEEFLFYKNAGTASQTQQPTIKTNNKSTMVTVEQPQAEEMEPPSPETATTIQTILASQKFTAGQKAKLIQQALLKDGYDEEDAAKVAGEAYSRLMGQN